MRLTPSPGAALIASVIRKSFSPGWAVLSRRIRSSDSPSAPQGTKCRMARSTPFSVAVISTQSPSPGPPMRPSAMEKPRSVELPRQESVTLMTRFELRARDVPDPPDLGDVAGLGHPVHHLPDVAHRTPRQAELRDVHDRLVAELQSGQVAFPAPHLGTEFAAPHDSGAPGVPCRHGEELGDSAGPRLRVADRVAGREHYAGHDAVADARLAGRRPDHALVIAQREVTERVPVALPGEQLADPRRVGRPEAGPRLRGPQEQVHGDHEREQAERAGQQVVQVAARRRMPTGRAVDADQLVDDVLYPLRERVVARPAVPGRGSRGRWRRRRRPGPRKPVSALHRVRGSPIA